MLDTSFESWNSILFCKITLWNDALVPLDVTVLFWMIGVAVLSQNKQFLSVKIANFKISKIAILKAKKCSNENDINDLGALKHSN